MDPIVFFCIRKYQSPLAKEGQLTFVHKDHGATSRLHPHLGSHFLKSAPLPTPWILLSENPSLFEPRRLWNCSRFAISAFLPLSFPKGEKTLLDWKELRVEEREVGPVSLLAFFWGGEGGLKKNRNEQTKVDGGCHFRGATGWSLSDAGGKG